MKFVFIKPSMNAHDVSQLLRLLDKACLREYMGMLAFSSQVLSVRRKTSNLAQAILAQVLSVRRKTSLKRVRGLEQGSQ